MANDAVIRSQSYAVSIEHDLRKVFNCDRFGFGGIANSDFIRKQPFPAMFSALSYIYATAGNEKRNIIEKFISDVMFYSEMSIDYLLSFDTSEKTEGISTIDIGFENGEIALEKIISDFESIIK